MTIERTEETTMSYPPSDNIVAALAGGMDADTAVNREVLLYSVQRMIFCKYSHVALDVRTAVAYTVVAPAHRRQADAAQRVRGHRRGLGQDQADR